MKDLQTAIADYYQAQGNTLDVVNTMCPSVIEEIDLPQEGNSEGDVRLITSTGHYYIFDGGKWNFLLANDITGESFVIATDEEIEQALRAGENG